MTDDAQVDRCCASCKGKISSSSAESHTCCGNCRFNLNGGTFTYGSRCTECKDLDDKAWDRFAALKLRLWKKSVNHLKSKLPDPLTHSTRISRSVLASLYKSLPPTISMWQFIEHVMLERKKAKFMSTFRDVDPSPHLEADGSLGIFFH